MEKTTTINSENYQESISWSDECKDFEQYGHLAGICRDSLAVAYMDCKAADIAVWAESLLSHKSNAVAEHMEMLLYIDGLEPRDAVIRLNTSEGCSATLRSDTDKVIRATDTKGVPRSYRCMTMVRWWQSRVKEVVAHCAKDYEREIAKTMERQEASRNEVLEFMIGEVDDCLGANRFGKLFFEHKDDLRVLVKGIHALSGGHQGEELDELISLAAQRQWLEEQMNSESNKDMSEDSVGDTVGDTVSPTSFEECIPEYLRQGRLFEAWERLVEEGYLTADKKLAPKTKKVAAQYIVKCFCANRDSNEWSHFEKLWGISNLRADLGEPKKSDKEKIDKIFTFCN
ncbi:MAG: hypothetical protein MJZ99_11225 [Bacteroidales bacterium]|nr:hypothetical protein [Bacteroidales bacterium]